MALKARAASARSSGDWGPAKSSAKPFPSGRGQPIRVCPKTSGGITKFSEHEADGGKPQKRQRVAIEVLPILCKPSAAVEPSKGAFDDPTPWKHHESFRPIGALDDFSFELWQDLRQGLLKVRPLVATIGKELF